jgi:preprotein translocase subunit YajC
LAIVLNFLLESMWLLAQEGAKKGPAEDQGFFGSLVNNPVGQLLPILMIGVLFYLMMMRPEQKKRKEMEQLLANIKKHDKIILSSGICGTVMNAEPKSVYVTIRVDESTNTKLRVLRSAIVRVGQPDEIEADAKNAG